jgi:hypothetical protein
MELCSKVASLQGSEEFVPAIRELTTAIHQHLEEARDQVADFALLIAAHDESNAAQPVK